MEQPGYVYIMASRVEAMYSLAIRAQLPNAVLEIGDR